MKRLKLANEEQARGFVFFQCKEIFRHLGDVIGCIEDVHAVCDSFGLDQREFIYDWSLFGCIYKLKKRGESYNVWVEVQDPKGLDELKTS